MRSNIRRLTAAGVLSALFVPGLALAQATAGIQHIRPNDRTGINIFEPPKADNTMFSGLKFSFGAAFAQQFQDLDHSNTAAPNVVDGVDRNELIRIGSGFNNATANLYMNAQLADGIRVAVTSYLSSRHHNETWVKDGYILVDKSPIDAPALNNIMEYVTLRIGHMEINYGDAHFRRSDNGNALYNPFVGNLIMDAFTTEVGAEVYVRTPSGLLAMVGGTNGEIRGNITRPDDRAPTYLLKLGFDKQFTEQFRFRLTGSIYNTKESLSNTLYGGDRAGSRYYFVMENTAATESANFTSGRFNPGLRSKVNAMMINPFIKLGGLEAFATIETATGRAANETADRDWSQFAGEVVYRFLDDESLYLGARINSVKGDLTTSNEVSIDRTQIAAGWFITNNLLMKLEAVNQKYKDFPTSDIRNGGKFSGLMLEAVVLF